MMLESHKVNISEAQQRQQQQQQQQQQYRMAPQTTRQTNGPDSRGSDASATNDFAPISVNAVRHKESHEQQASERGASVEEEMLASAGALPPTMATNNKMARDSLINPNDEQQPLRNRLRNIVIGLLAKKKETKMDNLEAMINESALKLLQQKELVFKQASCLQLDQLCKTTKFSRRELKWLYSGWKVACTDGCGVSTDSLGGSDHSYGPYLLSSAYYGIINEQQFQQIYAQFFPYGGDCSYYAKYVFQAMFNDTLVKNGGFITFADYAHALSNLLRGTIDDKIDFVFRLYDLNNDNVITLDELSRIFFAVYRLLGDNVNLKHDQLTYEQQAERLYNKIDLEQSGFITREQFVNYCKRDSSIVATIQMLEMSICSSA